MSVGSPGNYSRCPRVVIDELVYQQIMHWVMKSNYEVSGVGKVLVQNGEIRVVSAMLLPQKNTATTTDITGEEYGKAAYAMRNEPGELQFWWHSHVNMGVFWSGTDLNTIRALSQGGWFVATVFNKRHETKTAVAFNDPFPMMFDDCTLHIERSLPQELVDQWDKEYEDKVTNVVPKLVPVTPTRFVGSILPPLTAEERKALLTEFPGEDDDDIPRIGGLYGDEDWADMLSPAPVMKEHQKKDRTPADVIRDYKVASGRCKAMEAQLVRLKSNGGDISDRFLRSLEDAQLEVDELECELEALEAAGMITKDEVLDLTVGASNEHRDH